MKVIFDRSIFHKEKFDRLNSSNIRTLIGQNKLKVYYTPHFLDETLNYSLIDPTNFDSHWRFMLSLNSRKWFKRPEDLIPIELNGLAAGKKYYFFSNKIMNRILNNANVFSKELVPTDLIKQINQNESVKLELRNKLIEIRKGYKSEQRNFAEIVDEYLEWHIENSIMKNYPNSDKFLKTWKNDRRKCPFTEQYIRSILSVSYIPLKNQSLRISKGDANDARQLAYLIWVDAIVSDDKRFMKDAFNLLYEKQPKHYFSLNEFLDYCAKLNKSSFINQTTKNKNLVKVS